MQALSFDFENLNPGKELRNYLSELIPKEKLPIEEPSKEKNHIDRIDWYFKHDAQFHDLIYQNSLNYLVRKLIKSAHYYKKKNEQFDEYTYIDETRNYLYETTRFDDEEREKILGLLLICVTYFDTDPTPGTKRNLIRQARLQNIPCYMCGKAINYDDGSSWEFVQVEHIWPKGIGGSNAYFNLKVACKKCNHYKEEFIDSADFHFEQMSYKSILENSINHEEFKYSHKLAVWGKQDYKCAICSREAVEVGPLKFKRINEKDSWHFLNINAYCSEHY